MFPTTLTRSTNGHVRRVLIVTLATLLLFTALAIVPGAPGSQEASAASWVGNSLKKHEVWDPAPATLDWVPGHPKGYREGETAAFRVTIDADANAELMFDVCLDFDDSSSYAFTAVESWDTSHSGMTSPPVPPALTGDIGGFNGAGLDIVGVSYLGENGGLCPSNYLAWNVEFKMDADGGLGYVVYGGHLAAPGEKAPLTETPPSPVIVADGQGAASVSGVFQARVNTLGGGDKTVNFSGSDIIPLKDGRILVDKVTNPSGSAQLFDFTTDYGTPFQLADGTAPNDSGLLRPSSEDGLYSVAEAVEAGWVPTSATCDDGSPIDAIDLDPGETVTCTFTNTQDGKIIVEKQTLPDGSTQEFTFVPSWDDDFNLRDDWSTSSDYLAPGTYSVSETVPSGWALSSATCDDQSDPAAIDLDPGETVTCVFTNTKDGQIIVEKQTLPDGDPAKFVFTGDVADTIGDGQLITKDVAPGTYDSTEAVPAGWDLTSIVCDDANSTGTGNTATFIVEPGETVKCVFTNTKDGQIIVDKVTSPAGSAQSFDFTTDYNSGFSLADATTPHNSGPLAPGTYSVAEDTPLPSGWSLTSATCSDGSDPSAIDLDPGETVTCTFTNTIERGSIIVKKVTDPTGSTQAFDFTTNYNSGFSLADGEMDNSGVLLPSLEAGNYSVAEDTPLPTGWSLTSTVCVNGQGEPQGDGTGAELILDPGETITCTFTNTIERGKIIVDKVTDPSGSSQLFDFTTNYGDPFKLADATTPNDSGPLLPTSEASTYSVTEALPSGWAQSSATCSDGSDPGAIDLAPGETVTCTFNNTIERAGIIVKKVTDPSGSTETFGFTTNYGSGFSLADGEMNTSGALLPSIEAGTYSVAEAAEAGWVLTSATCDDGSPINAIVLDPGETVTCTFNNTQDGKIIVEKQTLPDGDTATFSFTGDVAGTIGDGGQLSVAVAPGTYTSTEAALAGWDLTGIVCDDANSTGDTGTGVATFKVEAGETVKCTFTNTKLSAITIVKVSVAGTGTFDFTSKTLGDFALTTVTGASDATAGIVFDDLTAGTYDVAETLSLDWILDTPVVCDDGSNPAAIALGIGEHVTCTFTNFRVLATAQGGDTVFLDKNKNGVQDADDPGINGARVWLKDADGNVIATQITAKGAWDGFYKFLELEPGTYTFELDMSSVSGALTTAGSFTVTLVEGEDYVDADFGVAEVLPVTGLDSEGLTLLAIGLLMLGAMAVLSTRTRREEN